jgi:hypothetical protein
VVNGNDFVTHVPFWILGFKHICKKYHIGKNRILPSLNDHRPENYLSSIGE